MNKLIKNTRDTHRMPGFMETKLGCFMLIILYRELKTNAYKIL